MQYSCTVLYYLLSVRLYHISPHNLINSTVVGGGGGWEEVVGHKICFDFYKILSETFLSLRRNERDIVINVHASSNKVPLILVRLQ